MDAGTPGPGRGVEREGPQAQAQEEASAQAQGGAAPGPDPGQGGGWKGSGDPRPEACGRESQGGQQGLPWKGPRGGLPLPARWGHRRSPGGPRVLPPSQAY